MMACNVTMVRGCEGSKLGIHTITVSQHSAKRAPGSGQAALATGRLKRALAGY